MPKTKANYRRCFAPSKTLPSNNELDINPMRAGETGSKKTRERERECV